MPNESVLHEIRRRLHYESLFAELLPSMRGSGPERTARCIFHEDSNPSMSVNVQEGLYCCHNPECAARGDIFDFYMRARQLTFAEAARELGRRVGIDADEPVARPSPDGLLARNDALLAAYRPPGETTSPPSRVIDRVIVDAHHDQLLATAGALEALQEQRGISRETVERWKLGWDGQRYFIPIADESGEWVNIRRYRMGIGVRPQDKMISWRQGFGTARLWPIQHVLEAHSGGPGVVYLLEGEMDCLLAIQHGLNALTTTGGAGTWREPWNELFRDVHVVICYDRDEAGRAGATHIARQLHGIAASVKVVTLPLTEPVGADFTDYIHGHGQTIAEFHALVATTPLFEMDTTQRMHGPSREPLDMHLSEASRAEHYNQSIRVPVMVSGKTMAPYLVPKEVKLSCGMPGLRMCERCPVSSSRNPGPGALIHEMDFEGNELLRFLDIPDAQVLKQIKQTVGVPTKCGYVQAEVLKAINVERGTAIPEIERSTDEAPYVTREFFYVGHGLKTNRSYVMTGLTVPDPKKQQATHLIHTSIPSQSNIDAFQTSEDVLERLEVFQPQRDETLWRALDRMYDDLERVTRIYERRDLMLAVDLVFHSPISFKFQGERMQRGWCEALIIGDSRTGKTTVVKRLLDHYGAGEFTTGENTTAAGLVGGLHQIGTTWQLQWGKVPMNDRRLVVVDEAGNLPQEQIARMSSMRSSGVAEVVKIHHEQTQARTRQIWISNPRSPRPLSSFSQGVLAVKELIGAPEDIARFDLVVAAATGDVQLGTINAEREAEEPETFTRELCHQRVMWTWSRQQREVGQEGEDLRVDWVPGAEHLVLELATKQGERYRYATEIPLVEPNEQRVKLARLAVSAAALFFSCDASGQRIVVRPDHVQFVYDFLERLYAKPSLAFAEYADMQRRRYELNATDAVDGIVGRVQGAAQQLMENETFTQRDLQEILGYNERDELRQGITTLREAGFFRRQGSSFYLKTPAAIRWLRLKISGERESVPSFAALVAEANGRVGGNGHLPDAPDF